MLFLIYEEDFEEKSQQTYERIQEFLGVNIESLFLDVKKIPGAAVKNRHIDKLINSPNIINQTAKRLLPDKQFRMRIKAFISKRNRRLVKADKSELEAMRPHLINDIYKKSILELEGIIQKDLSLWYKNIS